MYDLPYVDFTQEYWSPSAMDTLTVNDSLYTFINDISMNKLDWAFFLYYNKQVAEDYNVETQFGSPYDLVTEGKWTVDRFLEMVTSVSNDLDGDGKIESDDVYGIMDLTAVNIARASGVSTVEKNDDGSYSLSYYNEKALDIANRVNSIINNKDYCKSLENIYMGADTSGFNDQWEYARSFFATDHSLFLSGPANFTGEFRNMESDYGLLPYPKYDENQKDYIHTVEPNASLFAIPSTYRNDVSTSGAERTGMILEYMAYKSNEIVLPSYYDTLLKGQRLNSEQDCRMLDLIRSTVRYDFCAMIGLTEICDNFSQVMSKPATASSIYKRQERKLQKQLDDFYTDVLLLGAEAETKE